MQNNFCEILRGYTVNTIVSSIRLTFTGDDKPELTLTLVMSRKEAQIAFKILQEILDKGKSLWMEIKRYRKKRSLTANSYFWVLVDKIAKVIRSTPDEVYIQMLTRYGQRESELLSVIEAGAEMIYRATKNHCVEVGESELKGKTFKHLAILRGSSMYLSNEMAILIDGVVSECKLLNIETMSDRELQSLKESWGRL